MLFIRTLGESSIEVGDSRIGPNAPHLFAALLYLGLEAGRRIPRSTLQEMLFPDADEQHGAHSLRQLLYRIRRLGVELEAVSSSVGLAEAFVDTDFRQVKAGLRRRPVELCAFAAGVLPGLKLSLSATFEDWLEARRSEIASEVRRALSSQLAAERAAGNWERVDQLARRLLSLDPYNEEATLSLAEATAIVGSKLDAVQLLDSYLNEVGASANSLQLPAKVLRHRIAERMPPPLSADHGRFVGRQALLGELHQLLRQAARGESSACHLWGEVGIGKSRLVSEFRRRAVLDGATIHVVTPQPHDVRRPMGVFGELVPALLRMPGSLGCSPDSLAFLTRVCQFDLQAGQPLTSDVREAELLSANITHAISELLDALAAEFLLIIVVEDAQWIDSISTRVIADLIAERKHRRFMLVLTSREKNLNIDKASLQRLHRLRVPSLSPSEARELSAALLSDLGSRPDSDLLEWIEAAAAGNPFFLRSLIAHYAVTGNRAGIPDVLGQLLLERLEILQPDARRVFEVCAILGRHSTAGRIQQVLGLRPVDCVNALEALEELGFVICEGKRIVSAHALLTDVALKRASIGTKALLHRRAAEVLEAVAPFEATPSVMWDCADHWLEAGENDRAMVTLRACAQYALEIGRPEDACQVLERASQIPVSPESRLPILAELIVAAEISERWQTLADTISTYTRLRHQIGQPLPRVNSYTVLALRASIALGNDPRLLANEIRAVVADVESPLTLRVQAANVLVVLAEELMAADLALEAIAVIESAASLDDRLIGWERLRINLIALVLLNEWNSVISLARTTIASEVGSIAERLRRHWVSAFALLRAGVVDEGLAALKESAKSARAAGLHTSELQSCVSLACVLRDIDRFDEAVVWHSRASELAERCSGNRLVLNHLANCVLFALDRGDILAARAALDRASAIPASRTGYPGLVFLALGIRAKLAVGRRSSTSEVSRLLAGHYQSRGLGHHDEVMVAVCEALIHSGDSHRASALLREYLTEHRRLRWPVCPGLRRLVTSLPEVKDWINSGPTLFDGRARSGEVTSLSPAP